MKEVAVREVDVEMGRDVMEEERRREQKTGKRLKGDKF